MNFMYMNNWILSLKETKGSENSIHQDMKLLHSTLYHELIVVLAIVVAPVIAEAEVCRPSGKVRGIRGENRTDDGATCCKKRQVSHGLQMLAHCEVTHQGDIDHKQLQGG